MNWIIFEKLEEFDLARKIIDYIMKIRLKVEK